MAIVIIVQEGNARSEVICEAMANGLRACNQGFQVIKEEHYYGPNTPIAVFYGLKGKLMQAFLDYRRDGRKAVHIDLGYWSRTEGGKLYGYHKIVVNARHPTTYFNEKPHPADRWNRHGLTIKPWKKDGKHILIAGMGAKSAAVEGMLPNQWERAAITELRKYTDREIIFRPKPSWRSAEQIEGTTFSSFEQPLEAVLKDCHAIVSHHSNVCVDGLIEGIPAFCEQGVAAPLALQDLSQIETPLYPEGREQWAWNIAYTQWRPDEMKSGEAWRYLQREGLV